MMKQCPKGSRGLFPTTILRRSKRSRSAAKIESIRGKLNVPRERFHLRGKTHYLWAGLQFR